ncbi:DUF2125 domain-containing protein [Stappia sp. F7233]|uniref:DUF2125 domain-containing protein n=1 Tax=Stappia albiluteola TaxID=2758565 RepID=A0A839AIL7_9HYPH|nr:DUF2125 domain-containing protein [Stappia albiluteola]MBA5778597.1 DUF2125 domain-containing protein [Stappia albiluteola]
MQPISPARKPSRRGYYVVIALVLIVVGGWSAYWTAGRGIAADILRNAKKVAAAEGGELACSDQALGGFPFRFELSCRPLQIADARGNRATLRALRGIALAYNPKHLILEADGPLEASGATPRPMSLSAGWESARSSLRIGEGSVERVDAVFDLPRFTLTDAAIGAAGLSAQSIEVHARRVRTDSDGLDIALLAKGAAVPQLSAGVDAELVLSLPRGGPLLAGGKEFAAYLSGDEPVRITSLRLSSGASSLQGHGALTFNADGMPSGEVMLTVAGSEQLAATLAPFFPAESTVPTALQGAVLGLGGQTTLDGEPARSVTVSIDNGRARVGLVPLGTLPPMF